MKDPWVHSLVQLEPRYFELKDMVEKGTIIYPDLSKRGRHWCLQIKEEPPEVVYGPVFSDVLRFDKRVNWCGEQLSTWPDVSRMAYDMWYFKRKRDAEKFQTLYNLKWASEFGG